MAHFLVIAGLALYGGSVVTKTVLRKIRMRGLHPPEAINDPSVIYKYKYAFDDPMTRKEAALILGVPKGATEAEIMQAYKVIISLNHPDKGGSGYMAMKINQAKEVLLSKDKP